MHHAEISKIVEVFEDFILGMDSPSTVAIESFLPKGREEERGINIVLEHLDSKIVAQINDTDRGCNHVELHFYFKKNTGYPDVSAFHSGQELETDSIRFFVRSALLVLKDKIPLSKMKKDDFYDCTQLLMI
jgi:hypothetical protein